MRPSLRKVESALISDRAIVVYQYVLCLMLFYCGFDAHETAPVWSAWYFVLSGMYLEALFQKARVA